MEEPGQSTTGHFRESDIEFLRAQAKEWMEAVLGEDFDDSTSLEDMLADGALLYRVSQHIRDDVRFPGHVESVSHSVAASPSFEKKSSMKYQPYASVEAFLKVCKEVGLQDLDVFDPSDAVDKKDIRRVCVCLRRFSKKGRTLGIQVPDFDNVKDTLVTPGKMPREAVRRTQESLQRDSSRSSRSSGVNGVVSSETSSLIADLRKDDAESVSLELSEKSEGDKNGGHELDVAEEHGAPVVTDFGYSVKVAEPGVESLPLGEHNELDDTTKAKPLVSIRSGVDSTHGPAPRAAELDSLVSEALEFADRNGEEDGTDSPADSKNTFEAHTAPESFADSKDTAEAHTATESVADSKETVEAHTATESVADSKDTLETHIATKPVTKLPTEAPVPEKKQVEPFRGLVIDKPKPKPAEGTVEEKPNVKPSEQSRKGLFIAHLQGKVPYVNNLAKEIKKDVKKDNKKDGGSPWLAWLGGAVAIAGGVAGLLLSRKRSGDVDYSDDGHSSVNLFSGGLYKVRDGDNLTQIARKTGKQHWREIADRNPSIGNPDLIYPGDRLKL
ncbi:hypothetical protein KC19_5G156700 [Ceratodon purpureus]|uniref:LysM domain-containing protein n=1 Tax=Ceratodon purpureus TaxID=3225 RepID=A0A8T0I2U9_CERPU|nr:hypothetical protein KC19_5G156700 [Ceratodon purpureus]